MAPANQTKERSVHELFAGAFFRNKSSIYVNRACFPKEKHQNSQKWAKFMNFSFWPLLWFGLPGRLLTVFAGARIHAPHVFAPKLISPTYFYVLASGMREYSHCIHTDRGGKDGNTCLRRCEYIFFRHIIPQKYIFLYLRECEYRPHMHSRKN